MPDRPSDSPRPVQTRAAKFTTEGEPTVLGIGSLSVSRNPKSALARLQSADPFYLQVNRTGQKPTQQGRSMFTIQGVCDPLVSVTDLAALLEARFANGSQVSLSETGKKLVQEILLEVEAEKKDAQAKTAEAIQRIADTEEFRKYLLDKEKQLNNDPRIAEAERRVAQLNQEIENRKQVMEAEQRRHLSRLAQEELPDDFDPNRFPEAEEVALAAVERWKETLDDPANLVGGDYTELETILTQAMQRLAMKVADRYAKLVDV